MKSTIFLLICSVFYQCTYQEKINFTLYYEALCPSCGAFISNQLYPGFQQIGDALIIDLVPYGNAYQTKVNNTWEIHCQHGPAECYGNKIQGCVLKHHPDIKTQMKFVECMEGSSDPTSRITGEHCANSCNIPWTPIEKCSDGPEGDEILAAYGRQTQDHPYVPYMLFNGYSNETLEKAARNDFVKTVCNLLETKPKGCYTELEE